MKKDFLRLSTDLTDNTEKGSLVSFLYGNENNINNFPSSSFIKTKKDIYNEMGDNKSVLELGVLNKTILGLTS